ncbi:hypothetical protein GGR56DRAFT_688338 [Xylariaceae sp. FL0804]|nr:hypothetical protein GGR56DRAFT_688338 [Xylariaceae sp. FL0804]
MTVLIIMALGLARITASAPVGVAGSSSSSAVVPLEAHRKGSVSGGGAGGGGVNSTWLVESPSQRGGHEISCWWEQNMAVDDVTIGGAVAGAPTDTRQGYFSAVDRFCGLSSGRSIPVGGSLSMASETFVQVTEDPSSYGRIGYVYFTITNPESHIFDYIVSHDDCRTNLRTLGFECPGSPEGHDHVKNTNGGVYSTWSRPSAMAQRIAGPVFASSAQTTPPQQLDAAALDRLHPGPLSPVSAEHGRADAPALEPWPTALTRGVRPARCHSHNDYARELPLFEALTAGCVGIEADVTPALGRLAVGHDPNAAAAHRPDGPTLRGQYVAPLRELLDANANPHGGMGAVYPAWPEQTVVLLVDLKRGGRKTLEMLHAELAPLRERGYLSWWGTGERDGGRRAGAGFHRGAVTVVVSGDVSLVDLRDYNPDGDLFLDAPLTGVESGRYSAAEGSFYASVNLREATAQHGLQPGDREWFADLSRTAHEKGLMVRFWDVPHPKKMWRDVLDMGADVINADDLAFTARFPRF